MPDELTFSGLSTKTNTELVTEIQDFLQELYSPNGEAIDFSSASPDGQFSEILANIGTVHRELLTAIYNATDPSKCDGVQQDNKYQLNYVFRRGGTYTTQNIDVTATKTVTLQGLDGSYNDNTATAFTVSDDSGNLWYLVDTTTVYTGTTTLEFRAQNIGAVTPTIGTITNIVTVTEGIIGVINSVGYTTLGVEQESNYSFRIRRDQSTGNQSGNNADAILGNILALDGVNAARVHDNDTNSTDSTSTPAHTLWVIVDGGANTDIAEIIYANKGGSGTRGSVTVPIANVSGQVLNINFDRPNVIPLYIRYDLQVTGDLTLINQPAIKAYIAENLIYELSEDADTSKVTEVAANALATQNTTAYALNVEISADGTNWTDFIPVSSLADIFATDVNKITITVLE